MRSAAPILACALAILSTPAMGQGDAKAPPVAEKKTCKRTPETGSFARMKKICMTARQWRHLAESSKERGRDMQTLISTGQGQ